MAPSDGPSVRRSGSFKPRRAAAADAVAPAHVHLGAARRTFQLLPRRRLAAVRAEIDFAIARQHPAAVSALPAWCLLVLGQLEWRVGGGPPLPPPPGGGGGGSRRKGVFRGPATRPFFFFRGGAIPPPPA